MPAWCLWNGSHHLHELQNIFGNDTHISVITNQHNWHLIEWLMAAIIPDRKTVIGVIGSKGIKTFGKFLGWGEPSHRAGNATYFKVEIKIPNTTLFLGLY